MNVRCTTCDDTKSEMCSSKKLKMCPVNNIECQNEISNAAPLDLNMRFVQGILSLGLGYSAMEKFCMHMNIHIMSSKTFNVYKKKILTGHLHASNQLLLDVREAVKKEYGATDNREIVDIGVSYDGTWLTRGHTSNVGIGCVIDLLTGFVIDYEVMSKRCDECQHTKHALGENSAEFNIWYAGHRDSCSVTHVGSSGSMEVSAAVKIWQRSESIGFRYTSMLSDGDSKTFLELKEKKSREMMLIYPKKNVSTM